MMRRLAGSERKIYYLIVLACRFLPTGLVKILPLQSFLDSEPTQLPASFSKATFLRAI